MVIQMPTREPSLKDAPAGTVYMLLLLANVRSGRHFREVEWALAVWTQKYHLDHGRLERIPDVPGSAHFIVADLIQEGSKTDPHVVGVFVEHGTSPAEVARCLRSEKPPAMLPRHLEIIYGKESAFLDRGNRDVEDKSEQIAA
jgi:hypothetical protein